MSTSISATTPVSVPKGWRHRALEVGPMVPDVPDSGVDLARRVAELEAENRRLRQLLGIDGRPSASPGWEPTLFTERAEATERKVNRRSPPDEKLALFRALFQ